jgi:two-component system, OmpR family, KDP operon response regulator KdpE
VTSVLVVDDEEVIRRSVALALESLGYEVEQGGTARSALTLAELCQPDLIVLDLGLPDVDGIDVLRALRAASKVPILVITGRVDTASRFAALGAGANAYITKIWSTRAWKLSS